MIPIALTTQQNIKDSFEDFDPNRPDETQPVWAIWDGTRFRTFSARGHAVNAFHRAYKAKLYEFDQATVRWEERAVKRVDFRNLQDNCMACSTLVTKSTGYEFQRTHDFLRRSGKIIIPMQYGVLCDACRRANR